MDLWESDLWENNLWELAKFVRLDSCELLTLCRLCELCLLDSCELDLCEPPELDLCELTELDLRELPELDLSEFTELDLCVLHMLCLNLRASASSTPSLRTPLCEPPFNILSLCETPSLKRDT